MSEGHRTSEAVLLCDGRVLVVNGTRFNEWVDAQIYDPETGRFRQVGESQLQDGLAALRLLDGLVLVTGNFGTRRPTARLFDPATEE